MENKASILEKKELSQSRILNASRDLVWNAWTDPKQLVQWWGPQGFTTPVCEIDVRPNGAIYIEMKGPDGTIYPMKGNYLEIIKPERLVLTSAALDKEGKSLFEELTTINFTEEGGKTKFEMVSKFSKVTPEGEPYLEGGEDGWTQTIDRLEEYLSKIKKDTKF